MPTVTATFGAAISERDVKLKSPEFEIIVESPSSLASVLFRLAVHVIATGQLVGVHRCPVWLSTSTISGRLLYLSPSKRLYRGFQFLGYSF